MANKIAFVEIKTDLIDMNEGQVPGLPRNPRTWTYEELERLKASIEETPELLEARGLLVYPCEGRYVVLGGNMRYSVLKMMNAAVAPCIVLPESTPIDKLKELVLKDNSSFGRWDNSLLLTEWADTPFMDWGIDVFDDGEEEDEDTSAAAQPKASDGRKEFCVVFESDEFMFVKEQLETINSVPEQALLKLLGYESEE